MDKYYVLVIGSGRTSRANVDALLEDYFYAKGKNGNLVLAFDGRPSEGQIYAAQLARDKGIDIVVFNSATDAPGLPACSVVEGREPIDQALSHIKENNGSVFFLWDDNSNQTLVTCVQQGIPAFDLTEGLNALSPKAVEPQGTVKTPTPQELEDLFSVPAEPTPHAGELSLEEKVFEIVNKHLLSAIGVITEEVTNLINASKTSSKGF